MPKSGQWILVAEFSTDVFRETNMIKAVGVFVEQAQITHGSPNIKFEHDYRGWRLERFEPDETEEVADEPPF